MFKTSALSIVLMKKLALNEVCYVHSWNIKSGGNVLNYQTKLLFEFKQEKFKQENLNKRNRFKQEKLYSKISCNA